VFQKCSRVVEALEMDLKTNQLRPAFKKLVGFLVLRGHFPLCQAKSVLAEWAITAANADLKV
jgi:hypothetical protein